MSVWSEPVIEIGPDGTSLTLLQAIYKNPAMPLHTRMRAAIAALAHEHPRLGVTFQTSDETDFAKLLDQRIQRHQSKLIEHQPQPAIETKPPIARTPDRRFRRI